MKNRLPAQPGEWIDRNRTVRFQFEGRAYDGYAGDTLTSALAAHGVKTLGRSFKYHRPRGVYSLANHDVNAMVTDGRDTNIRADVTPLREGASYFAVNTFGGLDKDRAKVTDAFGRFLPVGFYYKTFHRPKKWFPYFERKMRAIAGLGAVDPRAPRVKTPKDYDWCDVLVIGGGPTGLAAAVAAAEGGGRVVLVDEHARLGGSLGYQRGGITAANDDRLLADARGRSNLDLRPATLAAGCYADGWVALVDEKRLQKMRARAIVMATGCFEQPALFRHNDLPGVMLATAAQRLIRQYAVKPCGTAVVLTANPEGYAAAADLRAAGVNVAAIVDLRPDAATAGGTAGVRVIAGSCVAEARPAAGKGGITGVTVRPFNPKADGHEPSAAGGDTRIDCDAVVMSVGFAPADSLLCMAGGKARYDEALHQFVPGRVPAGMFPAGRIRGVYDLDAKLADGRRAGLAAAEYARRSLSGNGASSASVPAPAPATVPHSHPYPIYPHPDGKVFVDLDEDVQYKDLVNAAQEGFDNIELLKRYSTFGMGPSQGKIANPNTIRVLARVLGQSVGETGAPTARPFYHPVALSHLGGRGFHPHRLTPLHGRHKKAGAAFMAAGEWQRPAFYASGGRPRDAVIAEEVGAVRQRCGVIDVGTLGKLEISGPAAAEFIERIYTGRFAGMKVGTTRYGLMCDESGVIIDDGVVARLGPDRFYVTTTTTASGPVYREMQRWAILWGLDVTLVNATGLYAAMNLAGPASRRVLAGLTGMDLSEAAFPYLGAREGEVLGVSARLMRVGFVGELGYEIHVPATQAARVWDGIAQAGAAEGLRPFGVEAQRVLRLEKAHVIIGQDTDGLTHPHEAGMAWAVKMDKPFFIGQRSLAVVTRKPPHRKLVGFTLAEGYAGPLPKECHLVIDGQGIDGRVTSIVRSPTLGRVIGLAFVGPKRSTPGSTFRIRVDDGAMVDAAVVETPFYDPKHARQTATA